MRKGWLAFLISMSLHGVVLAGMCLWPARHIEKPARALFLQNHAGASEDITITLISAKALDEQPGQPATATMEMPVSTAPPVPPPPERLEPKPGVPSSQAADGSKQPGETTHAGGGSPSGASAVPGGGNPGTQPNFFGVPARGEKIVYLIDASASMSKHGRLEAACAELLRSVRSLPPSVAFQIIAFNRTPFPLLPQYADWLTLAPDVLTAVEKALRDLPAEGATNPQAALKYALSRQPTLLFFLTDADEMRMETVREITFFNRRRSIVHVVAIAADQGNGGDLALQMLAEQNRGVFQRVSLDR